jgi:uncharacterized protein involved in exopolysaccharide biosynthesis
MAQPTISRTPSIPDEGEVRWREILGTLVRQKRLIGTVTLAGLMTISALAWLEPPIYRASAKILVQTQRAHIPFSPSEDRLTVDRMSDQEINAVVALLRSASLVRDVLDAYRSKLEADEERSLIGTAKDVLLFPVALPGILYRLIHGLPAPSAFDRVVQKTVEKIEVTPVKQSNLIEVAYVSRDPQRASTFINELIQLYITRHAAFSEAGAGQDFFRNQRELLGERLDKAQAKLRDFREAAGAEAVSDNVEALREQMAGFEVTRAADQAKLAELEARERVLMTTVLNNPAAAANEPRIAENTAILFLKSRLLELELKRSELLARYAPGSQFLSDLDRQIADTRALKRKEEQSIVHLMLSETRSQLAAARARVTSLTEMLTQSQEKLLRNQNAGGEREQLEQELAAARESYITYLKKEEQARFSKALDDSRIVNLSVAETADVPNEPEAAHRLETVLLGFVLSFLLGVALAFVREQLDPMVKTSEEAERLTGVPVITEIPT